MVWPSLKSVSAEEMSTRTNASDPACDQNSKEFRQMFIIESSREKAQGKQHWTTESVLSLGK